MKSIRGGNKNQVEAMSMDDLGTVSLIPQTETGFHDTGFQERRRIQERNRMCQANRRQIRQNAAFMEQTEGELQGRQKNCCFIRTFVEDLLRGIGTHGKIFKKNARIINTKVSFASVTMNTENFSSTKGISTLRVGGSIYHNIGSILADEPSQAKFMQCFFHSENNDSCNWDNVTPDLLGILSIIRAQLLNHNSFIRSLKSCLEIYNNHPQYKLVISEEARPLNAASRTYNAPVKQYRIVP